MTLYYVSIGSKEYKLEITNDQLKVDGRSIKAALIELGERGLYLLEHGSLKRELHVQSQGNNQYIMNANGKFALAKVEKSNGFNRSKSNKSMVGDIKAPISGLVVSVNVEPNDRVAEGDVVAVLESMKMQMLIKSPMSGVVSVVNIKSGMQLSKDDLLVKITPEL